MKEINIVPIFNQEAPGVWDDFFRIHSAALRRVYNIKSGAEDKRISLLLYKTAWKDYPFNFAFGAYAGAKMVGFIQGDVRNGIATVQDLYVLPRYYRHHIGGQLLTAAENAVSVATNQVSLVALNLAIPFYEKRGYIALPGAGSETSNRYNKKISGMGRCRTIPVFRPNAYVSRACGEISESCGMDFSKDVLDCRHGAMFMYMDVDCMPRGYVFATDSDKSGVYKISQLRVIPNANTEWVTQCLRKSLDRFNHARAIIDGAHIR